MLISFLRTSFCFWTVFALACIALFWPGLVAGEVPSFRDAFHFYYPQAVWLDQCAMRGEYFPVWQCNESLGVSVPGETTSALYYPLRIVWLLPLLSVAQRFALFVLVHLLLAGIGMQYACSRMRLRKEAGWMAGATFALSCPVLFQHNNLVFLSSASWLGFVLAELSCWLFHNETVFPRPRIAVLAWAIALMVLSGDPHTAVNVCILATFFAVARGVAKRSAQWLGRTLIWLAVVVLLAVGLSAVQSIPSLQWANQSQRWLGNNQPADSLSLQDRTEQELEPEQAVSNQLAKILGDASRRSSGAIYEFSLSPWHLLTTLWPTMGGNFAPENSRTFSFIAAEGRMWIPSLFFGVVPLLLLIGGFGRAKGVKSGWLVFAAIFALLASFGNYSLGWLLRETLSAFGADSLVRQLPPDHYGSLYGLLAEWLPVYSVFRYPAKWSTIAVACATLAAAARIDQHGDTELLDNSFVQRFVLLLSGIGLIVTLACSWFVSSFIALRPQLRPDVWLGAPSDSAMLRQLLIAFSIPILTLGLLAVFRWRARSLKRISLRARLPVHALFAWVSLLETFIVATCWCSFVEVKPIVPAGTWTAEFSWSDSSEANIERDRWLTGSNLQPAVEIADYQHAFALGKLGLLSHQHNLASILSIEPARIRRLRNGLERVDNQSALQPELDSMLAWLGVQKRLVRTQIVGERASFSWRPIPDSKRLCELRFADPADSSTATVSWRWVRSGQLEMMIDSPSTCRLLVRQLNDGGWQAVADREAHLLHQPTRDSSGLFIECTIASGKSKLILKRIEWPIQLGLTISVASLVFTLGIGYSQLRIASATRSRSK